MKKFEVGKTYSFADAPGRASLECTKVTKCFAFFRDIVDDMEYKAKKRTGALFLNGDVLNFELVKVDNFTLRTIDED